MGPSFMKTGTTIVGLVYKNGVIIAADQRATTESLVVDKETMKVHYIAPNIYCCGAGTAADADQITELVSNQLALMRLQTGKQSRLVAAMTLLSERLFQYGGNIQAASFSAAAILRVLISTAFGPREGRGDAWL